jgi:hypothetical protein
VCVTLRGYGGCVGCVSSSSSTGTANTSSPCIHLITLVQDCFLQANNIVHACDVLYIIKGVACACLLAQPMNDMHTMAVVCPPEQGRDSCILTYPHTCTWWLV